MNETAPLAPPAHDLSFLALFLQADPIVKGVMVALVLASLASWTVILDKLLRIRALRREARAFARAAQASETGGTALPGAAGRIGAAGLEAWRDRDAGESRAERRERIERAMRTALAVEMRCLQPGLPLLATIG